MIQLDLFTWRPKYATTTTDVPLRNSTPAQRRRAHRHAGSTVMVTAFIHRRFGK